MVNIFTVQEGIFSMILRDYQEIWKNINNFPDYKVSNLGRVKRITSGSRTYPERILNPWVQSWGYLQVTLNGHHKRVHLLVLEAFKGKKPDGHEGNHKDGDKKNNNIDNLEWVTPSENMKHSYDIGLHPKKTGEKHPMSKLTKEDVINIRKVLINKKWGDVSRLAHEYDVNKSTISSISRGKTWN